MTGTTIFSLIEDNLKTKSGDSLQSAKKVADEFSIKESPFKTKVCCNINGCLRHFTNKLQTKVVNSITETFIWNNFR